MRGLGLQLRSGLDLQKDKVAGGLGVFTAKESGKSFFSVNWDGSRGVNINPSSSL